MVLAASVYLLASVGRAEEVTVPMALQVDLLGRVVRFERSYVAHARDPALVVVVDKRNTVVSARAAAQVSAAIAQTGSLGGRPAKTTVHTFSTPAALRAASGTAAVIYLMPGFSRSETQSIAVAFADAGVLSVAAFADDVEGGMSLGFELAGSKPRIVVNLPQARAQRLDFSAQLLRLARVVQ